MALLCCSCSFGACRTCCGRCLCHVLWLVVAIGDGGEQGGKASWMMVVVEKEWSCLLMTPKLIIGKHRRSIWTLSTNNDSARIPFCLIPGMHSFQVIPETIPVEFEFCSKFRRNHLINLAEGPAKFDSSGIPGIVWIPPDSHWNQWRTIKTSNVLCAQI